MHGALLKIDNHVCGTIDTTNIEICSGYQCDGYRGNQTKTIGGETCIDWDDNDKSNYPNSGLDSNYCRNPDGEDTIWCYDVDGGYGECEPLSNSTPTDGAWHSFDCITTTHTEGVYGHSVKVIHPSGSDPISICNV